MGGLTEFNTKGRMHAAHTQLQSLTWLAWLAMADNWHHVWPGGRAARTWLHKNDAAAGMLSLGRPVSAARPHTDRQRSCILQPRFVHSAAASWCRPRCVTAEATAAANAG